MRMKAWMAIGVLTVAWTVGTWVGLAEAYGSGPADSSSFGCLDMTGLSDHTGCACRDGRAWYGTGVQDTWLVTADALFLHRRDPAGAVLIAGAIDDT